MASLIDQDDDRELIGAGRVGNELQRFTTSIRPIRTPARGPGICCPAAGRNSRRPEAVVEAYRRPIGERLIIRGRVGDVPALHPGDHAHGAAPRPRRLPHNDRRVHRRRPLGPPEVALPGPGRAARHRGRDAVVGRGFGLFSADNGEAVDSARHPWTLDNPAVGWFRLSSTVRIRAGHIRRYPWRR